MTQATRDLLNNLDRRLTNDGNELDRLRKEIYQVQGLLTKLCNATGYTVVYKPQVSSQAHYELVKIVPPEAPKKAKKGAK